jgi:hypothetical protein
MIRLRLAVLAGTALALATTAAGAQTRRTAVPSSMLPGPGLCRVWIEGVAPTRQPPVTDCATARANLRSNSRVVYGGSSNGRIEMSREERMRNEVRLREEAHPREVARLREQARLQNNDRSYNESQRRERALQKAEEKRLKALEKSDRKREKAWEKSRKHDGDDRDDRRRDDSRSRYR